MPPLYNTCGSESKEEKVKKQKQKKRLHTAMNTQEECKSLNTIVCTKELFGGGKQKEAKENKTLDASKVESTGTKHK
jgi:hypothetical protein